MLSLKTIFSVVIGEHILVVTDDHRLYLEIKYDPLDLDGGKEYHVCCSNGITLPITQNNRSFRNGMPIYRISLGTVDKAQVHKVACTVYASGIKEYFVIAGSLYNPIQPPKSISPTIPFLVQQLNSKLLAVKDNWYFNNEPLKLYPEYVKIIEEIQAKRHEYLQEIKQKRELIQNNRLKYNQTAHSHVSNSEFSKLPPIGKLHRILHLKTNDNINASVNSKLHHPNSSMEGVDNTLYKKWE